MSILQDGYGGYLVLILAGFLAHEPWRWLGLVLGSQVSADSEVFRWVRAVATALVAGLVMRLVLFPVGALAGIGPGIRIGAFVIGIAAFFAFRRSLGAGVASAAAALVLAEVLRTP